MIVNRYKLFIVLILALNLLLISCNKKSEEEFRQNLRGDDDPYYDPVQTGSIPYLSFLTLGVSYFPEKVKMVKNYESYKNWETEDDALRVNLMTFPSENGNKKDIVVFFRGTEAWRMNDLWADFDLKEENLEEHCAGCLVQEGYLDAFKAVEKETFNLIKDEIQRIKSEGNEINLLYFSGHSLGGAMAEIATHYLLTRKNHHLESYPYLKEIERISLITFGAPKIGNSEFVKRMYEDISVSDNIRVVYGIDEVPFFPPEILNYSFRHNGDLIYFRQKDFENYHIVVGFNRGNKKTNGETPKKYLEVVNDEQRGILNFADRVLDHLKYGGITKQTLSDAIVEIRNKQEF